MPKAHTFSIKTRLSYRLSEAGWLLLNVAAMKSPSQRVVRESLTNSRGIPFAAREAPDNTTRFHALAAPDGVIEIAYDAKVERDPLSAGVPLACEEVPLIAQPPEVVSFLYPSRYCESDKLDRMASKQFGWMEPGHERVTGICNWIYNNIDYQVGATDSHTSAVECLTRRAGVCRDFAHLGVALCRAMGIPARYASAYAYCLPQSDFHAFFEVWLGGRWWCYDATRMAPQQGFVWLGRGHDAADTAVATMSPSVRLDAMWIEVDKLSGDPVEYDAGPVGL